MVAETSARGRPWPRRAGRPAAAVFLAAAAMLAGLPGMLAAPAAASPASPAPPAAQGPAAAASAASPALTTDTPASCNAPQPAGHAQCLAIVRTPADHLIVPDAGAPPAGSLGPAQIRSAYNLPSGGAGQTVAVIDWGDDANAEPDLADFRSQYGLPPCTTASGCFRKVNEQGQQGSYPTDQGAGIEISLDVDAVSAACPQCSILLVEAASSSFSDLGASVDEAVALGADYISNSYGSADASGGEAESLADAGFDQFYSHPGVVVTASAGDGGFGVGYPAADPDVVSVGGTSLSADASVARGWEESVWGNGTQGTKGDGTGSGCSAFEPQPSWQASISALTAVCPANRAVADISADADPASGLAVYDTDPADGTGGWIQVGGTSLSSPLVAAMYALAGTPQPGTFPVTYPYQDPSASADLFDITSGSSGSCGTTLCNAAAGWDGPTGLGTPDGIGALSAGPHGTVTGTVTDASTGRPVTGAQVTAGQVSSVTSSTGRYTLSLPAGSYTATVTAYGYATATWASVSVTNGATTTENPALTPEPMVTVSGTVTDGSGQGWGLHASITIAGAPGGPVWTDPATGAYTLALTQNATTQLTISTDLPGYQTLTQAVTTGTTPLTENFAVPVDVQTCTAPGYSFDFTPVLSENFDDYAGDGAATAPPGWTVADNKGNGQVWSFANPGGVGNLTGGSGNFATVNSQSFGARASQITSLITPPFSLAGDTTPVLQFASYYAGALNQSGVLAISTDGGLTWTNIRTFDTSAVQGPVTELIPLSQYAGDASVQARFHFAATGGRWWQIDNVAAGNRACDPQPGGLVTGQVTDANTGSGLNGAAVAAAGTSPAVQVTSAATGDPAIGAGYYWLFSPVAGSLSLTAARRNYQSANAAVTVASGRSIRASFALAAGRLSVTPSVSARQVLGSATRRYVTLRNTGTAPVHVTLGQQAGTSAAAHSGGAALSQVNLAATGQQATPGFLGRKASSSPRARPAAAAGSMWSAIADYPSAIMDSGADVISGKVYSVGGVDTTLAPVASGAVYDPVAGSWTAIASMPAPLEKPAVAAAGGKLYVAGGWDTSGAVAAGAYSYDPAAGSWATLPDDPAPTAAGGVADLDGVVYFVAGCADSACTSAADLTSGVETYSTAAGTWSAAAPYPLADEWLSCGALDARIYCAGGYTGAAAVSSAYAYDPGTNTWSPVASLPASLWASASGAAGGMLVLSGGVTNGTATITNRGFAYDPNTDTWSTIPNAQFTVYRGAGSCGFYAIGGSTSQQTPQASSEQLSGLAQCAGAPIGWLAAAPASLTLQPGQRAQVRVTLSATAASQVTQPGRYTAQISFEQDTPYDVSALPVTMTVTPPANWGKIAGTLSGTNCQQVTSAVRGQVIADGKSGLQLTLPAGTDGSYGFWAPVSQSPFRLTASAAGWKTATIRAIMKGAGKTTTVPITLQPAAC